MPQAADRIRSRFADRYTPDAVAAANAANPIPRAPWADIIEALQRGEIDQQEAERRLDLIPEAKGMRLTRRSPNEAWHEATDRKRSAADALKGFGLTIGTGLVGGNLAALGNASKAAPALRALPVSAYSGGAGTTIPLSAATQGATAAGGAAGGGAAAVKGSAMAASSGRSMVPEALIGGGMSLLSSLLGKSSGGSFDDVEGEQKRFVNPTDSLYNALRAIASLGLGVSRNASQLRQLPQVPLSGGRSLPTPLGSPGLNTNAGGGQPDLNGFLEELINPAARYGPDVTRVNARQPISSGAREIGRRNPITGDINSGPVTLKGPGGIDPLTGQPRPTAAPRRRLF